MDKPNAESILPPEKLESAYGDIQRVMEDITHQMHGKQNQFLIKSGKTGLEQCCPESRKRR